MQRVLRFLVEDGARDFVGGAVEIFRDITEIVGGIELHARAIFAGAQLLTEIGELFHWTDDFDVEHIERESRAQHDQQAAEQHLKTTGAAKAINE